MTPYAAPRLAAVLLATASAALAGAPSLDSLVTRLVRSDVELFMPATSDAVITATATQNGGSSVVSARMVRTGAPVLSAEASGSEPLPDLASEVSRSLAAQALGIAPDRAAVKWPAASLAVPKGVHVLDVDGRASSGVSLRPGVHGISIQYRRGAAKAICHFYWCARPGSVAQVTARAKGSDAVRLSVHDARTGRAEPIWVDSPKPPAFVASAAVDLPLVQPANYQVLVDARELPGHN